MSSVQTRTTIGSFAKVDWIVLPMARASAEHPTNRAGRGFTDCTNRLRCESRSASVRATFFHSLGLLSARAANAAAGYEQLPFPYLPLRMRNAAFRDPIAPSPRNVARQS